MSKIIQPGAGAFPASPQNIQTLPLFSPEVTKRIHAKLGKSVLDPGVDVMKFLDFVDQGLRHYLDFLDGPNESEKESKESVLLNAEFFRKFTKEVKEDILKLCEYCSSTDVADLRRRVEDYFEEPSLEKNRMNKAYKEFVESMDNKVIEDEGGNG